MTRERFQRFAALVGIAVGLFGLTLLLVAPPTTRFGLVYFAAFSGYLLFSGARQFLRSRRPQLANVLVGVEVILAVVAVIALMLDIRTR